ncbi:MAG TPA: response regulator [Longimicrobiales bacterium]|nr:response regulator [Longimicrobiales bacterium]
MRKKVLLVEDNVADRNMYGNVLWYNGYDTLYAGDGEAALRLIANENPDIIILDLELPRIHGMEVASRVRQDEKTSHIPIIALTGYRASHFGVNPKVLGYADYMEKPVSPIDLLRTIESHIGRPDSDQAELVHRPAVVTVDENDVTTIQFQSSEDGTTEIERIGAHLKANIDALCEMWESVVREEPWFSLPREERVNNMEKVIESLADAAMISVEDTDARRRIVEEAAKHGEHRREQGIPENMIPIEFHLLRRAIWRFLSDSWRPTDETFSSIMTLDSVTSLALNAAMWGYFREEVDGQVAWDEAIARLIAKDSSFDAEPA